jgi:hypothetical protein
MHASRDRFTRLRTRTRRTRQLTGTAASLSTPRDQLHGRDEPTLLEQRAKYAASTDRESGRR